MYYFYWGRLLTIIYFIADFGNTILACQSETQYSSAYSPVAEEVTLETASGILYGTLVLPKAEGTFPVALIIAGSGPTDRNGNNPFGLNTNTLKMLAGSLVQHGIASLRYDKRGIAASQAAGKDEARLRFDDYVKDTVAWIKQLRKDHRLTQIAVISHSEGALIGMLAAQPADSLLTLGRWVDDCSCKFPEAKFCQVKRNVFQEEVSEKIGGGLSKARFS